MAGLQSVGQVCQGLLVHCDFARQCRVSTWGLQKCRGSVPVPGAPLLLPSSCMLARLCPRLLQPPHSPLQLPGSPHSKSAAAMRHLHAYQPPHQPPRPQPPRPQHSQRCRAACSSSGSQPTSSSAASYLVSPLNQHVQPAQPGEVAPLRLGPRLLLDVPLLAAPMAGLSCAPLRLMHTQARR